MKMNKFFAAIAATAVSVSAFAAMSMTTANAAETVAIAGLRGQAGTYTYWNEGDSAATMTAKDATVDGNAQYEATWELTGDGTGSIEFLILDIKKPADAENEFTKDTYPDLGVKVDEIYIDGEKINFTQSDDAYDLAYYESEGKNGTRAYLVANWGVNGNKDLGIAKDQAITSSVKVVFTVSGLYNDGTSNVVAETTAPAEETTTTTTTGANNDSSSTTTTTKAAGNKSTTTAAAVTSANTGDAGVGVAVALMALAGTAAFVARKKD